MLTLQNNEQIVANLFSLQSLPIENTFKYSTNYYQTDFYPTITSDLWQATAFAIWLHRLTSEEEIQLHLHLDGCHSIANLVFNKNTTSKMIYTHIEQALQTETTPASTEIAYIYSDKECFETAAIQFVTNNSSYQIKGLEALINPKNEKRYLHYYTRIIQHALIEQDDSILNFSILTSEEEEKWNELNNRTIDCNIEQTMHDVFKATALKYPNKIALKNGSTSITFSELLKQSDSIAQVLLEKEIAVGDYVSVYMNRSISAIVAMLGVMKAGAIYVPISPDNPDERNEFILNDSKSKIIIADLSTLNQAMIFAPQYAEIIEFSSIPTKELTLNCDVKPSDLAYIIYTSGSTGRPKGVKIPHKSIATFAFGEREVYKIEPNHVLTQFYTLTFDASMLELCPMLFFGNTLYMLSKDERLDISLFAQAIEDHKIDYVMMVPMSALKQFALFASENEIKKMQRLQCFGVGGEALPAETARLFQKTFGLIPLMNVYGPTECSVLTTTYTIDTILPEGLMNIPIGSPLPNYRVHILNDAMQYCPVNVAGELYIETTALAEGYLNLPEKTDVVFVKTPLSENLMYRSGDIVRLLENGQLEFVGRKDSQVKIRGYRVELGEIEEQLLAVKHMIDGAIIAKIVQNELTIVAYYKLEKGYTLTTSEILQALQKQLPNYMLPAYCIELDEFPLLPSGKINRTTLSNLTVSEPIKIDTSNKKKPRTETERNILHAWQDVLNFKNIGIDEDFFEIGGHSLKVLAILSKLKKQYPQLKINDFFKYRTIEQLAKYVAAATITENTIKQTIHNELIEHPKQLFTTKNHIAKDANFLLLTGATGYLGSHILLNLLQSSVQKVAVLVRSKNPVEGFKRLLTVLNKYDEQHILNNETFTNKIMVVSGDFTKENLAISEKTQQLLKKNLDGIIHCGADVRHFGDEEHFKKTNIDSTSYLIKFSQQCDNIRFHYVSTLGIQEDLASEGNWDSFLDKETILDAPPVESLYTNSKLESEKLLQLAYAVDLPVTIYRPGNISCQSTTGIFQKNIDSNAVYRMFKSFILLKKAPDVDFMMDFTMVDYASSLITNLALSKNTIGGIYNICNTSLVPFKEVISYFRNYGYVIDLVTEKQFTDFLYDSTTKDPEGVALAMAGIEGDGAKNSPLLYVCPNSMQFMLENDLSAPKPNYEFFEKMIGYAVATNYFPASNE